MIQIRLCNPLHDPVVTSATLRTIPVVITCGDPPDVTRFEARRFEIVKVNGHRFDEFILDWAGVKTSNTTGEERDDYLRLLVTMLLAHLFEELEPARTRTFHLGTLDETETLRTLVRSTGAHAASPIERMRRFAGEALAPTQRLLHDAHFVVREATFPQGVETACRACDTLLDETQRLVESLVEQGNRHLSSLRTGVGSADELLLHAPNMRNEIIGNAIHDVLRRAAKQFLTDAARFAAAFRGVADEATALVDATVAGLPLLQPNAPNPPRGGRELSAEDLGGMDARAADALFARVAAKLSDQVGRRKATRRPSGRGRKRATADSKILSTQPLAEIRDYLLAVRNASDPVCKLEALVWLAEPYSDPRDELRLFCRAGDAIRDAIIEHIARQIYREIRETMTEPERRLFKLTYFRLPHFNSWLPVTHPVLISFLSGMDDETRGLVLLSTVFRQTRCESLDDIGRIVEERFRSYLRLYPAWVEIVQSDERAEKRATREKNKTVSLDAEDPESDGAGSLHGVIPGSRGRPTDIVSAVTFATPGSLESWALKYCTPTQAGYLVELYVRGRSKTEIAAANGVSVQAVDKASKEGLDRIYRGLLKTGAFDRARFLVEN